MDSHRATKGIQRQSGEVKGSQDLLRVFNEWLKNRLDSGEKSY